MDKQTVTIDLARYEELLKKEALYDTLTESKDVEVYLTSKKPELALANFVTRGGEG